jgi:hypothetical protein
MRPTLGQALIEFGLTEAFRTQPLAQQIRQLQWVSGATADEQRERIADVLDELASYSCLASFKYEGTA